MKIYKETTVQVYVTPLMLRQISHKIELEMAETTLGVEVPSYTFYDQGLKIKLMADQDAYHRYKNGPNQNWT